MLIPIKMLEFTWGCRHGLRIAWEPVGAQRRPPWSGIRSACEAWPDVHSLQRSKKWAEFADG
jgi:hypothetical protein